MGKGKGKKGKNADPQEPPHDPGWERSVENGKWDRPAEALPDAAQWPTWGALRERILTNSAEICITYTQSLRDAFPAEVVKLSPPNLKKMEFRGSANLSQFVCSPITSCPSLQNVDLSNCASLQFVLIQSANLESLNISRCPSLGKALIQCKGLRSLNLEGCDTLHTLMLWSDSLIELDLSSCKELRKLELYCPELYEDHIQMPKVKPLPAVDDPKHNPIAGLLAENYNEQMRRDADAREAETTRNEVSSGKSTTAAASGGAGNFFTHMKV